MLATQSRICKAGTLKVELQSWGDGALRASGGGGGSGDEKEAVPGQGGGGQAARREGRPGRRETGADAAARPGPAARGARPGRSGRGGREVSMLERDRTSQVFARELRRLEREGAA